MAKIELSGISKRFTTPGKRNEALTLSDDSIRRSKGGFSMSGLDLVIPDGKTLVVLGPSGCGKSTLLRLLAGLDLPDAGEVRYDGQRMNDVPPNERGIGMVFQNFALYPNMKSRANVLGFFVFKKKTEELSEAAQAKFQRTSELMGVELEYLLDRNPEKLSGGEKQRVAIGRCITRDPKLFLLDEPFSSLDAPLREKYRLQLKKLLAELRITTVYVTHDQQEALILGDIVAVMRDGAIVQTGTFQEIYLHPADRFTAGFLNPDTVTPALNLLDGGAVSPEFAGMDVGVRPEDVFVRDSVADYSFPAKIAQVRDIPLRGDGLLIADANGAEIYASVKGELFVQQGQNVRLAMRRFHVFDRESGKRLRTVGGE